MSHLILFCLIISFAAAAVSDWAYTKEVIAFDGRPCITDCMNNRCVIDFHGNYMKCNQTDIQAPKYRTAEVKQKKHEYCLSNCGFFGFEYEWCMVSNDSIWDYCNSSKDQRSVYKNVCKDVCDKYKNNYYWCYIDKGSWQYCALPKEESGIIQTVKEENSDSQRVKDEKSVEN